MSKPGAIEREVKGARKRLRKLYQRHGVGVADESERPKIKEALACDGEGKRDLAALQELIFRFYPFQFWNFFAEAARIIFATAAVMLLLRTFACSLVIIPSESMLPTFVPGDWVAIEKLSYLTKEVGKGDVIVYDNPCDERQMIKRVVAVQGDKVAVQCDQVFVNETQVSLVHVDASLPPRENFPTSTSPFSCEREDLELVEKGVEVLSGEDCDALGVYVVPPGYVFAVGDNFHNSKDSQYIGPIPSSRIVGRGIGVVFSKPPEAAPWAFWSYNYERMGKLSQ